MTRHDEDTLEVMAREALRLFREKYERGTPSPEDALSLAEEAVRWFLTSVQNGTGYLRDAITLIAEMTVSEAPGIQRTAVNALFQGLIEPLNDSFDPAAADHSDQIMAQVIDSQRHREGMASFHKRLQHFGILSESDLLDRRSRVVSQAAPVDPLRLRKVLILSRVTIGADVAVTSVIAAHLRAFSPGAEIVLVGPEKLSELFGGDSGLRFRKVGYQRGGRLTERLDAWMQLVDLVSSEGAGLAADEFLVVDPDSRMTQLGLLPVTLDEESYAFFDSRRFAAAQDNALAETAAQWAATRWPGRQGTSMSRPFVSPSSSTAVGSEVMSAFGIGGARTVVFMSLGVGGNERKRVSSLFEELLVRALAFEATLIIDKGASGAERAQVGRILEGLANDGRSVVEAGEGLHRIRGDSLPDIVTWQGGIGSFTGLVRAADFYVGYDSAGQHIAAALGRPTLTVFVNSSTPRFAQRWRPTGSTHSRVLSLTPEGVARESTENLVSKALALFRELQMAVEPTTAA